MTNKYGLADLTDAEREALRAYKAAFSDGEASSPCFDTNRDLRNGLSVDELPEHAQRIVRQLDSVFDRGPRLSQPKTVYRGIGFRQHLPLHELGNRFRSLEFWSTAVERSSTDRFLTPPSQPGHGAVLTLNLPSGTPVFDMETLVGFGSIEAEFLLPRGMLWTVKNFSLLKGGQIDSFNRRYFETIALVELDAEASRRSVS